MNIKDFIESTYHKIGVKSSELIYSYRKGYIGKNTYRVTLNDGTVKTVDQITKNGNNGDAVIIVPITSDNKYVAIMESRVLTRTGVNISFPAGMIDEREKPIEAAIRELREETGYSCEEMIPLEWHYQDVGCSKSVVTTFLAKNAKKLYDLDLDQGERIETILLDEEFIESEMDNMESDNFKDSGSKVAFQYALKYRK